MREFSSLEIKSLLSDERFIDHPREQSCPACGSKSVRTYVYRRQVGERLNLVTYSWCAECRRFKGWTGPDLGDLEFTDPLLTLPESVREELMSNLNSLFRHLDTLWEGDFLPQNFSKIPAR